MTVAPPDQFPVADKEAQALAAARADLSDNDNARNQLRREVMGVELKMALRDLREGLRGMIRVSPLTSVITAALIGAAWSRRSRRRPVRR